MSRHTNWKRQHQSDEDFTQAAWDLLRDIEKSTHSEVHVSLGAHLRRGIWVVHTVAMVERVEGHPEILASYVGEYPNSRAASLAAYLFAHMNCLAQMAQEVHNTWLKMGGGRA